MLTAPTDIEVAITSSQVVGTVGTLFLLMFTLIGWLVKSEWKGVNTRLGRIEENTEVLPGMQTRLSILEGRVDSLSKRQHRLTNFVNRLVGRIEGARDMGSLDFDKEET